LSFSEAGDFLQIFFIAMRRSMGFPSIEEAALDYFSSASQNGSVDGSSSSVWLTKDWRFLHR